MVEPKKARPRSGRVLPVITSIMVVLPAPFGPMMQRSSPPLMLRLRALSALKPSKLTVMSSRYRIAPCATSNCPGCTTRPYAGFAATAAAGGCETSLVLDLRERAGLHQFGSHGPSFLRRTRPMIPCGRKRMTAMNSAPKKYNRNSGKACVN